ncbi:hypothetical protein CBM2589_U10200 [Cupriavidus taiwanensis]|uniref:Uncharacterized protein n=1 Tax=Cupriavidus taiwanensis TaxID=164546 RepID=A0A375CRC2_9BURK|nr:hypothetical protein CBM2589_U10200 [Cupriavidus taiwanensis]
MTVATGHALRQYIDAKAVFEAWESGRAKAAEIRGGMLDEPRRAAST